MSEFTNHQKIRIDHLIRLFHGIIEGDKLGELVSRNEDVISSSIPSDVIYLVDRLMMDKVPMPELKTGINKLLNLLYKTLAAYTYQLPGKESFLGVMVENNRIMSEKLAAIKPLFKKINIDQNNQEIKKELRKKILDLEKFNAYYLIKENVLFPIIERNIPEFRCLSLMWSFHDDIKGNLKKSIKELERDPFDLKYFNRLIGDLFFNINAVKFREERILYPFVNEHISEKTLNSLFAESIEIGFPFYQPELVFETIQPEKLDSEQIDLETGNLTVEQIKLLFNHLPVDITYVDEYDKVLYFSTPKKRIFPRTKAIIGRDVHNCHPKESVHVVEKIVTAFKEGKKESANFWINMKGQKLLIQYFAIRDKEGIYKGVVEVSQEISEIQNLQGENRLLDWEE
jgi:DUF438 domain-containing protein